MLRRNALAVLALALVGCRRSNDTSRRTAQSAPPPLTTAPVAPSAPPSPPATPIAVPGIEKLTHKPLLVLYERNPWLAVVGSDVPTLVVYEDGLAIVHRVENKEVKRSTGMLAKAAASELAKKIDAALAKTPHYIEAAIATDQPTVNVFCRSPAGWRDARCYGCRREGQTGPTQMPVPESFSSVYKELVALELPGEKPWVPEEIELMLWSFSHAKSEKPWPTAVPAPPSNVEPPASGIYRHLVSGRYEADVKKHLSSLAATEATSLNGRKWSLAYRARVPEEAYLQRVLDCAAERRVAEIKKQAPPACR